MRIQFCGDIAMAKPAVSRDAFRGLFAFYAARLITIAKPKPRSAF